MGGLERYVDDDTRGEEMKADRLAEQKSTKYERRKETAVKNKGRKCPPDKLRRSDEVGDGRTASYCDFLAAGRQSTKGVPAYPAREGDFGGRHSRANQRLERTGIRPSNHAIRCLTGMQASRGVLKATRQGSRSAQHIDYVQVSAGEQHTLIHVIKRLAKLSSLVL